MSIWYYDQTFKKVNVGREVTESDAYLYLPGPSLKYVDFDVRQPGCTAFAVNTAYPKVKPDYWIGLDKPACYDPALMYESFPKYIRGTYARKSYRGTDLTRFPNTYFADIAKPEKGIESMFQIKGENPILAWFSHTLAAVLHLILVMGHKRIHFIGCDLGGDTDYWDDRVLADDKRDYNRRLYKQQDTFLKEFVEIGKKYGVECISCTDHSPINRYMPFMPLKQAIERSQSHIPTGEVKHAVEVSADENEVLAEQIQWMDPTREKGVLVFADKNVEWQLDWWFYHYSKYNSFPVLFVDTGMTEAGATFCKARGSYLKLPPIELKGWFLKPFVLKMTTFQKTIYMDVDVEVRGSIYDMFDYEGFAISKDKLNNFSKVKEPVNTGVIVYEHGHPLIDEWCHDTIHKWHSFRSDQDVLDRVEKTYTEIPHNIHWLRIMGENKRALLYHHTGPVGKKNIRDAMVGL
jgi:hypothetical protein